MFSFLRHRRREPEWMDEASADPAELARSLVFIRRINAWLGYTRATIQHLRRFAKSWRPGETITVLDVATGSADVPIALLKWARKRQHDLRVTAVDLHAVTLEAARQAAGQFDQTGEIRNRLRLMQADATALPFANGSFDYVMTSMFLHHLDEEAVVRVLKEMSRVSRRGVIVADLLRRKRAYFWISLLTFKATPMVKHDARVSVAQAFTRKEIERLRDQAGLPFLKYRTHFGHRFTLAGDRESGGATE